MYKVCNSPSSRWPDSASCCVLAAGVTGPCSTEYRSFRFASRQPADATAVLNPSGSAAEVGCIKLDVQQVVSWGLQQQTLMLGTAGPCGGQGTCPKAEDKKVGSMCCTDEPASVCHPASCREICDRPPAVLFPLNGLGVACLHPRCAAEISCHPPHQPDCTLGLNVPA